MTIYKMITDGNQVNGFTCTDVKEDNHMVKVDTYQQTTGYYEQSVNKKDKKQTGKSKTNQSQATGYVKKNKETALSSRAQKLLKNLREKYGNMDFMVADFDNSKEAKKALRILLWQSSALLSRVMAL